jgi:hypothetical protein
MNNLDKCISCNNILKLTLYYHCQDCNYFCGKHTEPYLCWQSIHIVPNIRFFINNHDKTCTLELAKDIYSSYEIKTSYPYQELNKESLPFYLRKLKNYATFQ